MSLNSDLQMSRLSDLITNSDFRWKIQTEPSLNYQGCNIKEVRSAFYKPNYMNQNIFLPKIIL